jgi:hypothetical protein
LGLILGSWSLHVIRRLRVIRRLPEGGTAKSDDGDNDE